MPIGKKVVKAKKPYVAKRVSVLDVGHGKESGLNIMQK